MLESGLRKIPLDTAVWVIGKVAEQRSGSIDSAEALRLIEQYTLNSGEARTVDEIKYVTERRLFKILDDVKTFLNEKNAISWPIHLNSPESRQV